MTKYPRTLHVPWSPGLTSDDRKITSMVHFRGQDVVVTEKMDGENTSIYWDGTYHARSIDSGPASWRTRIAILASRMMYELPENWRICGENMTAEHSIRYESLPDYFLWFSIWEKDYCYPWKESVRWMEILELHSVPVIYEGTYDREKIQTAFDEYSRTRGREVEGYVIRREHGFLMNGFDENVVKWVRPHHVKTDDRWEVNWTPNGLKTR